MKLKKLPNRNTLEYFMFNYNNVLMDIKQREADIINSSPAQFTETGGGGVSHNSNPTELKGIKIAMDPEITRKRQWLMIIKDVVNDMKYLDCKNKTQYTKLIQKRYFDELADGDVQRQLGIKFRDKYKEMKDVIFLEGIMLAIAAGLISYDEIRSFIKKYW